MDPQRTLHIAQEIEDAKLLDEWAGAVNALNKSGDRLPFDDVLEHIKKKIIEIAMKS